jgi:hypothetical protein
MSLYTCDVCGHLQDFKFPGKSHPPRVTEKLCPTCTRSFGHIDKSSVLSWWHRVKGVTSVEECACTFCRRVKYPYKVVMKDGSTLEFQNAPSYMDCGLFFTDLKDGPTKVISSPLVLYVVSFYEETAFVLPADVVPVIVTLTNGQNLSVKSSSTPTNGKGYWFINDVMSGAYYQIPNTSVVNLEFKYK